ncbi:MAG: DNA gyrase subunit A [Candidatus Saccharimonadales bacterium]
MAKEESIIPEETLDNRGEVHERNLVDEMEKSYLEYSMSVIVARALPDVRDGLKPVHRRILYTMGEEGLRHNVKYRKSASTVGTVMSRYHPHGDSAIYDSLARMAQSWSMRYPLVDGQGNFGSMDGDSPAAMRYTEAKMTALAEDMLADIDKDTVDFRPNFDGSNLEPSVLPAKLPNLLLNGQMGIAVGMATNIPPHNLGEVIDALVYMIDNGDVTTDELLEFIKGPDFPTGGVIYGKESIRHAYGTGRGGVTLRAVAEIIEHKKGHQILISEIPYGQNKANLIEKIAELVKDKKINGIADLRDESSRGTVRIVIDLKKDAYPNKILNQLYKFTAMQTKFHLNMLALVDGIQPKVLNLESILSEYLKHRQIVIKRRSEFELRKAQDREHVLEGLKLALDDIDEVIKTIRASQSSDTARTNLMKKFKLTEIQANAILSMQLRTLAGLERKKVEDELKEVRARIKELEKILSSKKEILKVVKEELLDVRSKYGDDRRTRIVDQELGKFSDEELIPNEQVVVTITKGNYIKRTTVDTYRSQGRGGKGVVGMGTKEEDVIAHMLFANSHDYILFFTTMGRVFRTKAYDIPVSSRTAKGQAIVNLLQLHPEEEISAIIKLPKDGTAQNTYLLMATKSGIVKKTSLELFSNIRTNGIIAIKLDKNDILQWVRVTEGNDQILISTAKGQGLRFQETDVRPMGRGARGVRGIRLREGDTVVGFDVVDDNAQVLVVHSNGYGKRTKVKLFAVHKRGGLGVKAGVISKKTGAVVNVVRVDPGKDEILLISKKGNIIRLKASEISIIGRVTQGVRIMRLNKNDNIVSVALISEAAAEQE